MSNHFAFKNAGNIDIRNVGNAAYNYTVTAQKEGLQSIDGKHSKYSVPLSQ